MTTFTILGDQHLGRQFVNNVPLHRRGDRERMQWEAFISGLDPKGADVHVNVGDVFDKPIVSYGTVWKAALHYMDVAIRHPKTMFVVIRGNHDAARDLEMVTAFDIFTKIVERCNNIEIVDDVYIHDGMLFCGWHPTNSAAEVAASAARYGVKCHAAFGHYDVDPRSDPFNLAPIPELRALGVKELYVGHDHLKRELMIDGMPVHVVGSMIPFSHSEDANGDTYVTLSLDEARERDDLYDKCVRIDLQPGEVFSEDIDCLQLQVRRVEEERESIEVELGEFNLNTIFDDCMAEVPDGIRDQVRTRWDKAFSQQP
jgi:DNA repair exonuclease SbcCD nuclease subunit